MATIANLAVGLSMNTTGFAADANRATVTAERFTKRIEQQAATFGMNRDEARLYGLAQRGASEEVLKAAQAAMQQRSAVEASAAAQKDAEAIILSTMTNFERYDSEIQNLKAHLDAGRISQEQFNRAADQLAERLKVPTVASETLREQAEAAKRAEAATRDLADAQRRADAITESTRSSAERYDREIQELRAHLAAGRISQETFGRAVRQASDRYGVAATKVTMLDRAKRSLAGTTGMLVGGIGRLNLMLGGLVAAAGAAMGVRALMGLANSSMEAIDATAKVADRLGFATEKLVGLRYAAGLAGVEVRTFDMAMQRMTRRVAEAANGTGEAVSALQALGIDARSLAAMSPDQQFLKIADAMDAVGSSGEKVRLAFKLFDSEGVTLINIMNGGAAAIQELMLQAEKLGLTFTRVDAAKVEQANDALSIAQQTIRGAMTAAVIELAPAITAIADNFTAAAMSGGGMGAKVLDAMETVGGGIARVIDIVTMLRVAYKTQQGGVLVLGSITNRVFQKIGEAISAVINLIPGMNVAFGETQRILADEMWRDAEKIANEVKALKESSASDNLTKWFDDVRKKADAAAIAAAQSSKATQQAIDAADVAAETPATGPVADPVMQSLRAEWERYRVIGLSAREAERFKLEQMGATEAQLAYFDRLQDAIEMRQKEVDLIAEGVKLAEEADPAGMAERLLERQLAAINAAEAAGRISTAQADAATARLMAATETAEQTADDAAAKGGPAQQFSQMTLRELAPYLGKDAKGKQEVTDPESAKQTAILTRIDSKIGVALAG